MDPIKLYGTSVDFIAGSTIEILSHEDQSTTTTLKGLSSQLTTIDAVVATSRTDDNGTYSEILVPAHFPPGSVMVFATSMDSLPIDIDTLCATGAKEAFANLSMVDLNVLLYRADGEEKDAGTSSHFYSIVAILTDVCVLVGGDGVYTIPELGPMVYCGLQGWMTHVGPMIRSNDLGHPLAAHLRAGTWALDYVHERIEKYALIYIVLSQPLTRLCNS